MVDPRGEVYVVSKVGPGHHGKFVHLPASAWNQHHHVWVNDGVYLPITASSNSPVGGDISPSGTEVRFIVTRTTVTFKIKLFIYSCLRNTKTFYSLHAVKIYSLKL